MKKSYEYRERLSDFSERPFSNVVKERRKRLPSATENRSLRATRFKQLPLKSPSTYYESDFRLQNRIRAFWDPQRAVREFGALPLFSFSENPVVCPSCGHVDVVGHGPAAHKVLADRVPLENGYPKYQKALEDVVFASRSYGFIQKQLAPVSWRYRWKCRNCGGTFRWGADKGLKYPFDLWDVTLSSFVKGDNLKRINDEVAMEAERRGINVKTISSEAVQSIVQRTREILAKFEPIALHKLTDKQVKLGTVEMDYSPYPMYTSGSRIKQLDLENRNLNLHYLNRQQLERLGIRRHVSAYITGAIDVESRYPLPMVVGPGFDYRYSLRCLRLMIETFGEQAKPELIKCDGAICHRKAIRMYLPDVLLYTRTKKQLFNIVNYLEHCWGEFKLECLHPYRVQTLATVELAVEFKRLEHIFLRPHTNLNGMTPAQFLGIRIPKSIVQSKSEKWRRLLKLAYNTIMIEKCQDLRKF